MNEGSRRPMTRNRASSKEGLRANRREERMAVRSSSQDNSDMFSPPLTRHRSLTREGESQASASSIAGKAVLNKAKQSQPVKRSRSSTQTRGSTANSRQTKKTKQQESTDKRDYLQNYAEYRLGQFYNVNIYARLLALRRYKRDKAIEACFQDDFSANNNSESEEDHERLEYLAVSAGNPPSVSGHLLRTRVMPEQCFDGIIWDGTSKMSVVFHPKYSDVIHKGIISLNSLIQITKLFPCHVPGSLEKREAIVVTDFRLQPTHLKIVRQPQQLPTEYECHELLPRPLLSKRAHYLPVLADDLMQEIWSWKVMKQRMVHDETAIVRPTTPTLAEIMNTSNYQAACLAATTRVRHWQSLHSIQHGMLPTVDELLWDGSILRHGHQDPVTEHGSEPTLFGRIAWISRVLHYGTFREGQPSFKLNIRIMDASDNYDVVCWGNAAAYFDTLRRMIPGKLVGVQGYRKKAFKRHEVSLNEDNPHPRIFSLDEPSDNISETVYPGLSDKDTQLAHAETIVRFPLPSYRWCNLSLIPSVNRSYAIGVAGLVTSVGPVKRRCIDPWWRSKSLSSNVWEEERKAWLLCRYVSIVDQSTSNEFVILLFANSNDKRFLKLKPGAIIGISHLFVVSSESSAEEQSSFCGVTSPVSRIFNIDELQHLCIFEDRLKNALTRLSVPQTRLSQVVDLSTEHLRELIEWVRKIELTNYAFGIIGNSALTVETLQKCYAFQSNQSSFSKLFRAYSAQLRGSTLNDRTGASTAFSLSQMTLLAVYKNDEALTGALPTVYEKTPFALTRFYCRPSTLEGYQSLLHRISKATLSHNSDTYVENMKINGLLTDPDVDRTTDLPLMDLREIPKALTSLYILESCPVVSIGHIVEFVPPEFLKAALTFDKTFNFAEDKLDTFTSMTVEDAILNQFSWLWNNYFELVLTACRLSAGVMVLEDLNRSTQVPVLVPSIPTITIQEDVPHRHVTHEQYMDDLIHSHRNKIKASSKTGNAFSFAIMKHIKLQKEKECVQWLNQYLPARIQGKKLVHIAKHAEERGLRLAFCLDLCNNGAQQGSFPQLETIYELKDSGEGV